MNLYSIHQPNFLPWIGFFHKILSSERVILFDSVQISSGKSYTSRVKILFNGEERWLTLPIKKAGFFGQKISETQFVDYNKDWSKNLGIIRQAYLRAPYFKEFFPFLENFKDKNYQLLADFNSDFIQQLSKVLGGDQLIFYRSSSVPELMVSEQQQTDYIIETCKYFNVVNYLSGKGGSSEFLELDKFKNNNIEISFQQFKHPIYKQLNTENFYPGLSIIDMIMNIGIEKSSKALLIKVE